MTGKNVSTKHFVVAYGKGGLDIQKYNAKTDALIILTDPNDPTPKITIDPSGVPVLHLQFSDISDQHMPWVWRFAADHCKSGRVLNFISKRLSGDWPTIPFTPLHAQAIIDFASNIGFDRSIHVCCTYGRSRSVTVAQFLTDTLFPGFELRISRHDARINTRIRRILLATLNCN